MAFPWSGKKDMGETNSSEPTGDAPDLERLAAQLDQLGGAVTEVNRQLTAYLVHRESGKQPGVPSDGALGHKLDTLVEQLDQLGNRANNSPNASADEAALTKAVEPVLERIVQLEARLGSTVQPSQPSDAPDLAATLRETIGGLEQRLEQRLAELAMQLAPAPHEEADATDAGSGSESWLETVLGPELMGDAALESDRTQLQADLLAGNAGAMALAGQLLAFRSSPSERLPQQLKEVGEAYYRWRPKTSPGTRVMEESLAGWLARECESQGISNTIELVHPGERFDSTRHTASSRGVEITEVRGWIVLRDNGRVYTKATVAVR